MTFGLHHSEADIVYDRSACLKGAFATFFDHFIGGSKQR